MVRRIPGSEQIESDRKVAVDAIEFGIDDHNTNFMTSHLRHFRMAFGMDTGGGSGGRCPIDRYIFSSSPGRDLHPIPASVPRHSVPVSSDTCHYDVSITESSPDSVALEEGLFLEPAWEGVGAYGWSKT